MADDTTSDTLQVCTQCKYTTIQSALHSAAPGATIEVLAGTYREWNLKIQKPVHLIAKSGPSEADRVVIDGDKKDDVFIVERTQNVTIEGFDITHSGFSYTKEMAAIKIEASENCRILKNRLSKNYFGIYVANSKSVTLAHNQISGIPKTEANTGNGIHIWQGEGHTITHNETFQNRDGIYFEFVKNSKIESNHSHDNLRYGLHFMQSNNDTYVNNRFTKNGAGVAVMYSHKISMIKNEFSFNKGPAAYGLLLKEIFDSTIENNHFLENSTAIYMEGANRTKFLYNDIYSNGWALKIMGSCERNRFYQNNFKSNTFEVGTNTSFNNNEFIENYWSGYNGYDMNRDEIGDKPHRLSTLSSVLIERIDSSFILLHSYLFRLMDEVERALPELIPERLKDERPLMRPSHLK